MSIQILVADDEAHIVRALSFVLQKEGFSVDVAHNGEEALRKIRETRPRLVFLDLIMPKMTGLEVCKLVKSDEELCGCHIVILTSKGQQLDRDNSMAAGADEYMMKPFSPRELVARTRVILCGG